MMKTKETEMTATAPKLTKTALAIQTMNANTDRSMEEVIPMIAEASGVPLNIARNYYVWCVRKGVATGVVPAKAPKAARAPKVKVAKTVKVKPAKAAKTVAAKAVAAVKPTAPTKSPDEIARIKAANLKRMQEVHSKMQKLERRSPEAETPNVAVDNDPFAAPAFLTRSELESLV